MPPQSVDAQAGKDGSCFDRFSPCLSQFYCWLPRRMRQQPRGYASGGIFTTAEADFTTTESTRKQVPCGPGELSRQSHMGQGLPPICIRPAIRFIANTPLATRAGVVSSVVVRAISSKTHDGARDRTRRIGLGGGPRQPHRRASLNKGCLAAIAHSRFWQKADISRQVRDVRFQG